MKKSVLKNRIGDLRGSTLIEIMVTLFVLTAGLLVLFGMFPQGFNILSNSKNIGFAAGLLKNKSVSVSMRQDNMPIAIVPCDDNGNVNALINENPNEGKPTAFKMENGEYVQDNKGKYVRGKLLNCRKVIGESTVIPGGDDYTTANGNFYGGKYTLMFGPIDTTRNTANKKLKRFVIYGSPMTNITDVVSGSNPLVSMWNDSSYTSFWAPNGDGRLYLAFAPYYAYTRQKEVTLDYDRIYKISYLVRHETTHQTFRKEGYIQVAKDYNGEWSSQFQDFDMDAFEAKGTTNLTEIGTGYTMLPDSLEVRRVFEEITPGNDFGNDPYQYIMADPVVGTIMFNPLGTEVMLGDDQDSKEPLKAYIDYLIYDPRIAVKDIQFPRTASDSTVRINLGLGSILSAGAPDVIGDGTQTENPDEETFEGLIRGVADSGNNSVDLNIGVNISDPADLVVSQSILIMDSLSGLRVFPINPGSEEEEGDIVVDYDNGVVIFKTNEVCLKDWHGETVFDNVNITDRVLRFYFRTTDDWNVRMCKLPETFVVSTYETDYNPADNLSWNEFGIPKSSDRLYFPQAYAGGNVVVDYEDANGKKHFGQLERISDYPENDDESTCYVDLGREYKEIISVHGVSVMMGAYWRSGDSYRTRQMLFNVYGK